MDARNRKLGEELDEVTSAGRGPEQRGPGPHEELECGFAPGARSMVALKIEEERDFRRRGNPSVLLEQYGTEQK